MFTLQSWQFPIFGFLIFLHLRVAPYTKVEESFNIQAIHDILQYGAPTSNVHLKLKTLYDHMTFPGSVPRTFIGSLVVASIVQPIALWCHVRGLDLQIFARAVLGFINAVAINTFANTVRTRYGKRTAWWYIALQSSQFHIIYYASRTLPNTFAFSLSTFALAAAMTDASASLATRRYKLSFYLLTLATVIFRSELALLIAAQSLTLLFKDQGHAARVALIRKIILPPVIAAAIVGIMITVAVDTYFWQSPRYLWPEAEAFIFNIFPKEGHTGASAWGTSPWYWYFVSAMPRLVLSPCLLLLPYGVFFTSQRQPILDQLIPSFIYTAIYSALPHKETRFLFPIVPQLTLAMALTASYISLRRQLIAKLITIGLVLSTVSVAVLSHVILLPLSAQSYPGADALRILQQEHHRLGSGKQQVHVYLTNLALQTGITRFLEQPIVPGVSKTTSHQIFEQPKPLILPGSPDGRFPALTHYPRATTVSQQPGKRSNQQSLWKYDKTTPEDANERDESTNPNNNSSESNAIPISIPFWNRFDYVIVENPHPFIVSDGEETSKQQWDLLASIPSLSSGRPSISRRSHDQKQLLVLGENGDKISNPNNSPDLETGQEDGIYTLLRRMYPWQVAWIYAAIHDVLVHGVGLKGVSLTRGYWIEYQGLQNRLYVFARRDDLGFVETDSLGARQHQGEAKVVMNQSAA